MLIIDDSLVGSPLADQIQSLVFGFEEPISWKYSDMTNRVYEDNPMVIRPDYVKETFYFSGFIPEEAKLYKLVLKFLTSKLAEHGLAIEEVSIFRVNIFTKKDESYAEVHHTVHADETNEGYVTFLYYIEDSDGGTRFFNEKYEKSMTEDSLSVRIIVDPVKGRYALFDSTRYHASASPVDHDMRPIINVILKVRNLR